MEQEDFFRYHNYHCLFTLKEGNTISGVVFLYAFTVTEEAKYYFVRTNDLIEFKEAQLIGDIEKCRQLAAVFNLDLLEKAERLN